MVQRLSRKELYELVWSEPMKSLSGRFGISDVALKKTCARAAIKQRHNRGYPATAHELSDSKLSFAILSGAWSETERVTWRDDDTVETLDCHQTVTKIAAKRTKTGANPKTEIVAILRLAKGFR